MLGEGEAKKVRARRRPRPSAPRASASPQALAIEEQVRAYGGPQFQLTQQVMARFAEAIEEARVDVVPRILIGGGGAANGADGGAGLGGGNLIQALLAMLLNDRLDGDAPSPNGVSRPEADAVRRQLRERMAELPKA